jgi:hypothetical protein
MKDGTSFWLLTAYEVPAPEFYQCKETSCCNCQCMKDQLLNFNSVRRPAAGYCRWGRTSFCFTSITRPAAGSCQCIRTSLMNFTSVTRPAAGYCQCMKDQLQVLHNVSMCQNFSRKPARSSLWPREDFTQGKLAYCDKGKFAENSQHVAAVQAGHPSTLCSRWEGWWLVLHDAQERGAWLVRRESLEFIRKYSEILFLFP